MSLLDNLSFDEEKIIWNYFHSMNKLEEKIKSIINCNYLDNYEYESKDFPVNLLDFLEIYSTMHKNYDYKKPIRIKFQKEEISFNIDEENVKKIINNNEKIFNRNIKQIVKLYHSDTIYILI